MTYAKISKEIKMIKVKRLRRTMIKLGSQLCDTIFDRNFLVAVQTTLRLKMMIENMIIVGSIK